MKYWLDRVLWCFMSFKRVLHQGPQREYSVCESISWETVEPPAEADGARAQPRDCSHYCLTAQGGQFQLPALPCQLDWPASQPSLKILTYYLLEILESILCALYLLFMHSIHRDKLSKWWNSITFPWKESAFGEMQVRGPLLIVMTALFSAPLLAKPLAKNETQSSYLFFST